MEVSLVIVALNEEHNLERCVRSVPFADEVLVVDSGSTDATVDLAESLGCRVLGHEFQGYSRQKQWALERAGCDWVLFLDADEFLDEGMAGSIKRLLSSGPRHAGYTLPFKMLYMGRLMRFGPWLGERHLRLFKKKCAEYPDTPVHEGILLTSGTVGRLDGGYVVHESYKNIGIQVDKMREYAALWAIEARKAGTKPSIPNLLFRPLWRFFAGYVLKGGFLEGVPGLTASVMTSFYVFLKWLMLTEMNGSSSRDSEFRP